ncbi:MAG TPA: hypothetical protein VEK79_07360 [Thermoanaerobaculia bacterium]|nr:hypothetical protein [Thermoanaerobaculia bacterium]
MRNVRLQLILCITFLISLAASAQTFEQVTFARINEHPMSIRGAAMGAVSEDDVSTNPASMASTKKLFVSAGAARSKYHVFDTVQLTPQVWTTLMTDVDATALSHIMVAAPVRNFVVSGYYRNEPEFRGTHPLTSDVPGVPYDDPNCPNVDCGYLTLFGSPAFARRDERYGAAIAWERGAFSFGAGAELRELEESVDLQRLRFATTTDGAVAFDRVARRTSGRAIVPNASIRWKATPRVALSAAYNGGATFTRTSDVCQTNDNEGACVSSFRRLSEVDHTIADAYRASISFQPIERLLLVAEGVRRNYSKVDSEQLVGNFFDVVEFKDVTELHAGAELRLSSLALRAGWWRDPARTTELIPFTGFGNNERVDHMTFGAGVDLGPARLDIAFDDVDAPALRRASVGLTFKM